MTRINTNIASIIAQSQLGRTHQDLQQRLERLSTGLRINRGADDPAGLIVSERLRAEIRSLEQAVRNSDRAASMIATTEGYLAEVADMLNSIKALAVEAANTGAVSPEEIEANQLQVDSAIESITRIANTASFSGLQLLNGSLAYRTEGVDTDDILNSKIHNAYFGNNTEFDVTVTVLNEAEKAALYIDGDEIAEDVTIEVAGNEGVQTLSFVAGVSYDDVVTAVNNLKDATGVEAVLLDDGGAPPTVTGVAFQSVGYGSDQFVSVKKLGAGGASFETLDAPGGDATQFAEGVDVNAIINGNAAQGKGLDVTLKSATLSLDLSLSETFAATTVDPNNPPTSTFQITGGGATFQIGPKINATQQVGFGIDSIAASRLGATAIDGVMHHLESLKSGHENSLVSGNASKASKIIDQAITDISVIRGNLGAFERNTLQTNARALQIGIENLTASESLIRDTDFARETAALTRAQILSQAGTSVLATANLNAQNVLALLQ